MTTSPSAFASAPTSRRVARNSVLHFLSFGLPAVLAVLLVPVTVRSLGPGRFGLLALGWAVAEGAGMFDLGLARTTVRYVADAIARGGERLSEIIIASTLSQVVFGLVAGALLFAFAPFLVGHVFKISPAVKPEAAGMFRVVALHIPVLLAAAALRAALEGAQRFDISTAIRIPGSIASVAIPAAAAFAGASLPQIMWILLAVRLALVVVSGIAVSRTLLSGGLRFLRGFTVIRDLLGFSGWVALSAALGPVLGSFDRFVVGSVVGVVGLGFYTGAAEAANRFLLIPATAFAALLPALTYTSASGGRDRALMVTYAARRQLAALLLPLCLALCIFAPAILTVWLGSAFSAAASSALRILAIGVFLGGLAHLPLALLYGAGRPDVPAKIHVAEVLVHIPLTYALIKMWGITGAGMAWSLRCAADLILYEWASRRALGRPVMNRDERTRTLWLTCLGAGLCAAFAAMWWLWSRFPVLLLSAAGACFLGYAVLGWVAVLAPGERQAWKSMLPPFLLRARGA